MKHIILAAASCMALLCSCEDFIDLKPLDQITMEDYWSSATELEYYTRQLYPIFFGEKTMTGISSNDNDDAIYDLKGMRISSPRHGEIYIKGGKKIIQCSPRGL